jgi:polysaccharide pyruvyl transferase WcaK-like protein
MKKILKTLVKNLMMQTVRIYRKLHKPSSLILIPSALPMTNLGDQAMLLGSINALNNDKNVSIFIVLCSREKITQSFSDRYFSKNITIIDDLYLAFVTKSAFIEEISFIWLMRKVQKVFLVAADVLGGDYNSIEAERLLNAVNNAATIGVDTTIIGFSLSENINTRVINSFKKLNTKIKVNVRDKHSLARLNKFKPGGNLVADSAFLMNQADFININYNYKKLFNEERLNIAVCLCEAVMGKDENRDRLMTDIASVFIQLGLSQKINFIFLPHHPRDITLIKEIMKKTLKINNKVDIKVIEKMLFADEIKAILSKCDHVITSRMHVTIATLGAGRAVTSIPYGGKFEGLFEHFEMTDELIPIAQFHDQKKCIELLNKRFKESKIISSQIKEKLPVVIDLAQRNFT